MTIRMPMGVAVLAGVLFPVAAARADAVAEVHELLERIEEAQAKQDFEMLGRQCDETLLAIVPGNEGGAGARVLTREQVLGATQAFWKQSGIEWRRFVERDIQIVGDVAQMGVGVAHRFRGNRHWVADQLTLAIRRDQGWKICFSMPRFFRPVALVTDVADGSAGERAQIQPGDIITACGGKKIASGHVLMEMMKAREGSGSSEKLAVIVCRGGKNRQVELGPGGLGVQVEDRLLPTEEAALVEWDEPHPIKSILREQIKACGADDAAAFRRLLCPAGFFDLAQKERGATAVITLGDFDDQFHSAVADMRKTCDPATAEYKDIGVIVQGDVAVATCRFVAVGRGPDKTAVDVPSTLEVYVRQDGKWCLVASLPPTLPIRAPIGLTLGGPRTAEHQPRP